MRRQLKINHVSNYSMVYKELSIPNLTLSKKYISFIYEIQNDIDGFIYTTIPNGKIGFSFIASGEAHILRGGTWVKLPRSSIFGLTKKIEKIKHSSNFRELCIGFKPEIFQLFIDERMSIFTNGNSADMELFYKREDLQKLIATIGNKDGYSKVFNQIEVFLSKVIEPNKENSRLNYAMNIIRNKNYRRVDSIAKELNVSPATLRNLFTNYIGLSPKDIILIHRIYLILNSQNIKRGELTKLAYTLGYSDQAHMNHNFKQMLNITPRQYFENKSLVFDFYNYHRWTSIMFVV